VHVCCKKHDACFDAHIGQQLCDDYFCDCLSSLESEGEYCDLFTHYGLCASTRLLGFWFYEHGALNMSALGLLGEDADWLLDAHVAGIES
jgi:hypothetical protein